jgi:hypothetical protein
MSNIINPRKAEDYYCYNVDDPNFENHTVMLFRAYLVIWDTKTDHQFIREILVEDVHIEKAMKQVNKISEQEYENEYKYWIIAIEQTGEEISRLG